MVTNIEVTPASRRIVKAHNALSLDTRSGKVELIGAERAARLYEAGWRREGGEFLKKNENGELVPKELTSSDVRNIEPEFDPHLGKSLPRVVRSTIERYLELLTLMTQREDWQFDSLWPLYRERE